MSMDQIIYSYIVREQTYGDGDIIIQEGTKSDWVYFILEGTVKIKKKTSRGQVSLATLQKGSILGELTFLSPEMDARTASAVATEGQVRLGILDRQRLLNDYDLVPTGMKNLIKSMVTRLREANRQICNIVANEQ
jgi:CRP-like cAMP-binding protein